MSGESWEADLALNTSADLEQGFFFLYWKLVCSESELVSETRLR